MPSQSAVAKQNAQSDQLRQVEVEEQHSSAQAQAGLNLNLAAAVSGIFSGSGKKTTTKNADGSERTDEENHAAGQAHGSGVANLSGMGQAQAQNSQRKLRQQDHLGLEGQSQQQQAIESKK